MIDTGASANAINDIEYEELKSSHGTTAVRSQRSEVSKIRLASGQLISVRGQVQLEVSIAKSYSKPEFQVLPNTNCIILGNPFFKNNSIELYPRENLMEVLDLTLQLNETSKQPDKIGKPQHTNSTLRKCVIAPNQQTTLKCNLQTKNKRFADVCGIVESKACFEEKTRRCIISSLCRTDSQKKFVLICR